MKKSRCIRGLAAVVAMIVLLVVPGMAEDRSALAVKHDSRRRVRRLFAGPNDRHRGGARGQEGPAVPTPKVPFSRVPCLSGSMIPFSSTE